jgi:hypothetical protein
MIVQERQLPLLADVATSAQGGIAFSEELRLSDQPV